MTYVALPLCFGDKVSADNPKLLTSGEKLEIIADFVVAALATTVGVLVILQLDGLVNLGLVSGIGSIGSEAAWIMIGVGGGIMAIDLAKLMIQQARLNNRLRALETKSLQEIKQTTSMIKGMVQEVKELRTEVDKHIRQERISREKALDAKARIQQLEHEKLDLLKKNEDEEYFTNLNNIQRTSRPAEPYQVDPLDPLDGI